MERRDLGSYGVTPQELPVKPGDYTVIVELPGYVPQEFEGVNVEQGRAIDLDAKLISREGALELEGSPGQVTVSVDGIEGLSQRVALPATVQLPVGARDVRVSAPGYADQVVEVEISERDAASARVDLERETGTIVVRSSEPNSAILLDGKLMGFTPVVLDNVAAGPHRVTVSQEGFAPRTERVEVSATDPTTLEVWLEAADEVSAASSVAETVSEAPASVSLVSSLEIESFGYLGTADALRGVRGLYFTDDATYTSLGVRGYSPFGQFGNRVLVQIDGHNINENWSEASYNEFELLSDLYGLERIEVVRGPASVLYGSGAYQGVINLVTPDVDRYRASRVGGTAVSDGVLRGYAHARAPIAEDAGAALSVGGIYGQGQGYTSRAYDATAPEAGQFDAYTVMGRAGWGGLSLHGYFHSRDVQIPTGAFDTIFGDLRTRQTERPRLPRSALRAARQ